MRNFKARSLPRDYLACSPSLQDYTSLSWYFTGLLDTTCLPNVLLVACAPELRPAIVTVPRLHGRRCICRGRPLDKARRGVYNRLRHHDAIVEQWTGLGFSSGPPLSEHP